MKEEHQNIGYDLNNKLNFCKNKKTYIFPEFRVVLKNGCKSLFFKGDVAEMGVPIV